MPARLLNVLTATKKGIAISDTLGEKQELLTVSESGLYTIVLHWRDAAEIRLRAERWCHAALKRKNLDLNISTPYPCA
jgi:prophage antirepressor-like protein